MIAVVFGLTLLLRGRPDRRPATCQALGPRRGPRRRPGRAWASAALVLWRLLPFDTLAVAAADHRRGRALRPGARPGRRPGGRAVSAGRRAGSGSTSTSCSPARASRTTRASCGMHIARGRHADHLPDRRGQRSASAGGPTRTPRRTPPGSNRSSRCAPPDRAPDPVWSRPTALDGRWPASERRAGSRRPGGSRRRRPCEQEQREPSASRRTVTASRGTLWPTTRPSPSGVVTRSPIGRGGRLELLVQRVLVLEAAHQPAARAGDAHRVERQVLVLGHPDGDRLEVGQERGAAQVPPAGADAALHPGRVAGGELAQLDPAVQGRAQVADQGPEVDPVRRGEVDRGARTGAGRRGRGRRTWSTATTFIGSPCSRISRFAATFASALRRRISSSRRRSSSPASPSSFGEAVGVLVADPLGAQTHSATSGPSSVGDQHPVAHGRAELARVEVVEAPVPVEADRAEHAHAPHPTLARTRPVHQVWPSVGPTPRSVDVRPLVGELGGVDSPDQLGQASAAHRSRSACALVEPPAATAPQHTRR